LAADDFRLGCELCAVRYDMGSPETAYLQVFDDLPVEEARPPWPVKLELALSNKCNLQCVMCNGELSSSIRIHREGRAPLPVVYDDRFFAELDEFLPHLRQIVFLGGEPFLGAEPRRLMERLMELELQPHCHVTTNGTQWNERVEAFVRSVPVHIAVSVDGYRAEVLESVRVGVDRDTVMTNVDRFREATRAEGKDLSLSFCLMRPTWGEMGAVLAWGDRLDVDVFVNTVTAPPHLSLHHAPAEELAEIVTVLRSEDASRREGLGRNRAVWIRELEAIEHLAAGRVGAAPSGPPAGALAHARALAEDWADERGVHEVEIDESEVVAALSPDAADVFGIDLRGQVGEASTTIFHPILDALGTMESSEIDFHTSGVEERRVRLRGPEGTTDILLAMVATNAGGQRWFMGARPAPSEADLSSTR
jgi:molybdenum cofactor biosynthesis enzyme MoaA